MALSFWAEALPRFQMPGMRSTDWPLRAPLSLRPCGRPRRARPGCRRAGGGAARRWRRSRSPTQARSTAGALPRGPRASSAALARAAGSGSRCTLTAADDPAEESSMTISPIRSLAEAAEGDILQPLALPPGPIVTATGQVVGFFPAPSRPGWAHLRHQDRQRPDPDRPGAYAPNHPSRSNRSGCWPCCGASRVG